MTNFWWMLMGMTAITFSCRYLFFARSINFQLGPRLKRALTFAAPSVLTAMWVPIVFLGHESSELDLLSSPFLYAGLLAIILSLKIKNTLVVVISSMSIFVLLNMWLAV